MKTVNQNVYYNMDELGRILKCSRIDALEYVRVYKIPSVRYSGNTYISEDELVKHLMERNKLSKGV